MKFQDIVKEYFSDTSDEYQILCEIYEFITSTPTMTKATALQRLEIADILRSKLVTIIYMAREILRNSTLNYRVTYDQKFTQLTAVGRPSAQSIECEILHKNPELRDLNYKIERIESFIYMLQSFVKSIDQVKLTTDSYLKSYSLLDK